MLVDTHVLLDLLAGGERLGSRAQDVASGEQVFVSSVSIWEIPINRRTGRLRIDDGYLAAISQSGFRSLPLLAEHAAGIDEVEGLGRHDPFDRVLLSQARIEGLDLDTWDRAILAAGLPFVRDARF